MIPPCFPCRDEVFQIATNNVLHTSYTSLDGDRYSVGMTELMNSTPASHNFVSILSISGKSIYGSRRNVRDLKSKTSKGSKTRLYQIVHTTDSSFLIVELVITRSKM